MDLLSGQTLLLLLVAEQGTSCSGFNRLGRYGTSLEHAFGVQHGKQAEVEAFLEEVGAIVSLV